jgi:hypothetical protein
VWKGGDIVEMIGRTCRRLEKMAVVGRMCRRCYSFWLGPA